MKGSSRGTLILEGGEAWPTQCSRGVSFRVWGIWQGRQRERERDGWGAGAERRLIILPSLSCKLRAN